MAATLSRRLKAFGLLPAYLLRLEGVDVIGRRRACAIGAILFGDTAKKPPAIPIRMERAETPQTARRPALPKNLEPTREIRRQGTAGPVSATHNEFRRVRAF